MFPSDLNLKFFGVSPTGFIRNSNGVGFLPLRGDSVLIDFEAFSVGLALLWCFVSSMGFIRNSKGVSLLPEFISGVLHCELLPTDVGLLLVWLMVSSTGFNRNCNCDGGLHLAAEDCIFGVFNCEVFVTDDDEDLELLLVW